MIDVLWGFSLPWFHPHWRIWAFNCRFTWLPQAAGLGIRVLGVYCGFRIVWKVKS